MNWIRDLLGLRRKQDDYVLEPPALEDRDPTSPEGPVDVTGNITPDDLVFDPGNVHILPDRIIVGKMVVQVWLLTQGAYDEEVKIGIYPSLERARGQAPVTVEWEELEPGLWQGIDADRSDMRSSYEGLWGVDQFEVDFREK